MNKIPFKAVAVDVDGTFMDDQRKFDHPRFNKILNRLRDNNIHFIVSSGRPLVRLRQDFNGFLDRIDLIANNGAILVQDDNIISSHYFSTFTGKKLLKFIQESYPTVSICASGLYGFYYLTSTPSYYKKLWHYYYPGSLELDSFDEIPDDEHLIKLGVAAPASWAESMEKKFNNNFIERIQCIGSGFDNIDVMPYGVNKARALKYFLRFFDVKPQELIAFGDGPNDREMLELAGYSYAMANATPDIIKLAKFKAPSNNDSGVLKVLEDYLN